VGGRMDRKTKIGWEEVKRGGGGGGGRGGGGRGGGGGTMAQLYLTRA